MKTQLAAMDDAAAKRIPKAGVAQDAPIYADGRRERAPVKGVKDSDNPTQPLDLVEKRERAPAEGEKDSPRGGGNKDPLSSGKGKREQAPEEEAKDSDNPFTFLDADATDTRDTDWETRAGAR